MTINGSKPKNLQELADRIKEALTGEGNHDETLEAGKAVEIFRVLSDDESFLQEIEQILAYLCEQTLDLTKLQSQIILIIKKYLGKFDKEKFKRLDININEKLIAKNITEVSQYLMEHRSLLIKRIPEGLIKSKDKLYGADSKTIKDTKRIIKNFAVYQIYKFMNPRRIAGETKKENFAYNFIKGGLEYAKKFEGGSKSDIQKYSKKFLDNLQKAHQNFKTGGRIIS